MAQTVSAEEAAAPKSDRRQIEEVVVTAERKEASISDTSISITAFTGQMLEDFGIRNAEDLQNMIPAAVIQPYDMAIRGIGRNFRNLGGDPGIATYANSVYSEDFGIASSEGGLFDIERVEVLRGPQGTLYGRNAIGGAVNFINKKPTNEFEGEAKVITGSDGLQEEYGMLSGPVIEGILAARITGVKRQRDGAIKDLSGNQDPDNFGDENYSLALQWTPNDDITWLIRGNERSLRRRMGGADAAGIITFSENGIDQKNARDTSTYVFGYRAVDPTIPCADQFTRTAVVAAPGVRGGVGCMVTGANAPATKQFHESDGRLDRSPANARCRVSTRRRERYDEPPELRVRRRSFEAAGVGLRQPERQRSGDRHQRSAERRFRPTGGHVGAFVAGERQGDVEVHLRLFVVLLRSQHRCRSDQQRRIRQPVLRQPGSGIRLARIAGVHGCVNDQFR